MRTSVGRILRYCALGYEPVRSLFLTFGSVVSVVLVVDRGESGARLAQSLGNIGYRVCGVAAGRERAIAMACEARPDLIVVSLDVDGGAADAPAAAWFGSTVADVPVVLLANGDDRPSGAAMRHAAAGNVWGVLQRPFSEPQLATTTGVALAVHARERERRELQAELHQRVARLEEAERRVRQMERQARLTETIFDSISDGVVVADAGGAFTMFNPSAERIIGIGKLDLDTEQWSASYGVYRPDRTTRVETGDLPLVRAINGEATDDVELYIRNEHKPDGVLISVSGRPLRSDEADAGGGVIVFRDVTQQKAAQEKLNTTVAELRYQNDLIDTAFRSISDGIVVANANGEFLYVNPAAGHIVGIGISDGPPEKWSERYGAFYPDRETPVPTEELPLLRAIHRGESVDEEDVFIRNANRSDGIYIRVSARPLLNDVGGIRGGVIVFRDVTARVFAEEALTQAFAEGRLEIVDTVVHNIGNAITSVTTGIETLRQSLADDRFGRRLTALADALSAHADDRIEYLRDDPQGRKVIPFLISLAAGYATRQRSLRSTVERVRDRARRIADIVRNEKVLGTAGAARKDIDLHDALLAAFRVLRDSLAKRGIRTAIDCRRAPREIRIRESQFHQMLVNLIKNSMDAIDQLAAERGSTREPFIRVRAWSEDRFLNVEVIDSGIGLETSDVKVLFAPGYTTKPDGSGLGLHSSANFVIASGGHIRPASDGHGKGTAMRVMLPLSSVVPPAAAGDGRASAP